MVRELINEKHALHQVANGMGSGSGLTKRWLSQENPRSRQRKLRIRHCWSINSPHTSCKCQVREWIKTLVKWMAMKNLVKITSWISKICSWFRLRLISFQQSSSPNSNQYYYFISQKEREKVPGSYLPAGLSHERHHFLHEIR